MCWQTEYLNQIIGGGEGREGCGIHKWPKKPKLAHISDICLQTCLQTRLQTHTPELILDKYEEPEKDCTEASLEHLREKLAMYCHIKGFCHVHGTHKDF